MFIYWNASMVIVYIIQKNVYMQILLYGGVIGNITSQVTPEELHERCVTQATQENATAINNLATNVRNLLVMVNQNPDQIGLLTCVATTQQVVQTGHERMFNAMVVANDS